MTVTTDLAPDVDGPHTPSRHRSLAAVVVAVLAVAVLGVGALTSWE
jgi:hypothetical protein